MTYPHIIEFYSGIETTNSTLGGINRTFPATGKKLAGFVQYQSDIYAVINQTEGNNTTVNVFLPGVGYAKPYDRLKFNNLWFEVRSVIPGNGLRGTQYTKLVCSGNNQAE